MGRLYIIYLLFYHKNQPHVGIPVPWILWERITQIHADLDLPNGASWMMFGVPICVKFLPIALQIQEHSISPCSSFSGYK